MVSITKVVRITRPDGSWLDMHLPSVNQQLDIMDLPDGKSPKERLERMRFYRDLFRDVTVATSWGGDSGDLRPQELLDLVQPWLSATEDDAVPPAPGSSSATPRAGQRSRRQTANARRSGSRRSSPS